MDNILKKAFEYEKKEHALNSNSDNASQKESNPATKKFNYTSFEQLFNEQIEFKPIANGFAYERDPILIHATGGTGKSMLAQFIAMELASHTDNEEHLLFGKFHIPCKRNVLFLQAENSKAGMNLRIKTMVNGLERFKKDLPNLFCLEVEKDICVSGNLNEESFKANLIEIVKTIENEQNLKLDILILDPLVSYHCEEENNSSGMRKILDNLNSICNELSLTPIIVHHDNRNGAYRGSSAIFDWARNIISLKEDCINKKKVIKIEHEKANNFKKFEPFYLEMDENLCFQLVDIKLELSEKDKEKCENVKQALSDLGGECDNQNDIVKQYVAMTNCSDKTAKNHIKDAIDNGYIFRIPNKSDDKRQPYIFTIKNPNEIEN